VHQITAYGGSKGKAPFQQAVPQSPGWSPVQSNVQTENTYQKFLRLTNSTSLAQLRALPSEVIMRANSQQITYDSAYGQFSYGPVVDGNFVPLQPGQLLAQGRFDKSVRVMVRSSMYELHVRHTLTLYRLGITQMRVHYSPRHTFAPTKPCGPNWMQLFHSRQHSLSTMLLRLCILQSSTAPILTGT
jgi:carboxylesterase type B